MENHFRSHDFGYFEIVNQAWKIYWKQFTSLLLIGLVVYLPYNIALYFISYGSWMYDPQTGLPSFGLFCGLYLFISAVAILGFIAVAYLVEAAVQGNPRSAWVALRYSIPKWPVTFFTTFLLILMISIGMLFLIIPGIILAVFFFFTSYIVALRNISVQAFDYSYRMVKGQWWRVFGIYLGIFIPYFVINYLLNLGVGALAASIGIGSILLFFIINMILLLVQVCWAVLFLNIDYRKHPAEIGSTILEAGNEIQTIQP